MHVDKLSAVPNSRNRREHDGFERTQIIFLATFSLPPLSLLKLPSQKLPNVSNPENVSLLRLTLATCYQPTGQSGWAACDSLKEPRPRAF